MERLASRHGERLLLSKSNPISYAVSLDHITAGGSLRDITYLGSMLFSRSVSGTRVVPQGDAKVFDGVRFGSWGAQCDDYPTAYFTAAAAMGMTELEVDVYIERLDGVMLEYARQRAKARTVGAGTAHSPAICAEGATASLPDTHHAALPAVAGAAGEADTVCVGESPARSGEGGSVG